MADDKNCERVKNAYIKSGLTYAELAELTGFKKNTLLCYTMGRRTPSDLVVATIEEKVSSFVDGDGEYINKITSRENFIDRVYEIFDTVPEEKQPLEIIKAFDKLPTVSLRKERKNEKEQQR